MKFNWGHGIALILIGFIAFIATLVYGTFQQRVDLSSEDYYQQEVNYETEKDAIENGLRAGKVNVTVGVTELTVQMPEGDWSEVKYLLMRPDNAEYDVDGEIEDLSNDNAFIITRPQPLGWWNIEITAINQGKEHRWEFNKYF